MYDCIHCVGFVVTSTIIVASERNVALVCTRTLWKQCVYNRYSSVCAAVTFPRPLALPRRCGEIVVRLYTCTMIEWYSNTTVVIMAVIMVVDWRVHRGTCGVTDWYMRTHKQPDLG